MQFSETCPELAKIAHKIALVRSFSHDSNDHLLSQAYTLSGRKVPMSQIQTEPNIGSIVSYLHGPRNLLPGYIAAYGWTRPGPPPYNMFVGGWLGEQYAPFAVAREPIPPRMRDRFRVSRLLGEVVPDLFAETLALATQATSDDVHGGRDETSVLLAIAPHVDETGRAKLLEHLAKWGPR